MPAPARKITNCTRLSSTAKCLLSRLMAAPGAAPQQGLWRSTTTAPVNIAVVKYWGKRDAQLNLPTNSSLSVTLSQRDLRTLTTASCSPAFQTDSLMLNGAPQDLSSHRTQSCLRELRSLRRDLELSQPTLPPLSTYRLHIVSSNNFPTAAGLASSAAGFAALVRAIADLYRLPQTPEELSRIARQGSGSACRSLFGGFAAWNMGQRIDGADSMAALVAPASHWPTLRALILVISDAKKDIGSTPAMVATVETSSLFRTRAQDVVPQRMSQMAAAIEDCDFSTFGFLTMRDSNSFHATCLDTWPPVFYLTDASRAAIRMVEAINTAEGEVVCAYTFDAGPNAVIFYEAENEDWILGCFRAATGNVPGWEKMATVGATGSRPGTTAKSTKPLNVDQKITEKLKTGVSSVILTGIGEGPISVQDHLVSETGEALTTRNT